MPFGGSFIVFSDDWGRHPSSCQHIFGHIASKNRVLWVNTVGMRKPRADFKDIARTAEKIKGWMFERTKHIDNLIVYSPVMFPFVSFLNTEYLVYQIKRKLALLKMHSPVLVTTVPHIADAAGRLGESMVVYYCVDDFSKWPGMRKDMIFRMEKKLLNKADMAFTVSDNLCKGALCPVYSLPHGVDTVLFKAEDIPENAWIKNIKKPVIGYFGLIDGRIDLGLIEYAALTHPMWSLVILGRPLADTKRIRRYKNVHFSGEVPYDDLPGYIKGFSVCILPYLVNEQTLSITPLKLKECLASGKPVVSVSLPETEKYGDVVYIAHGREDFTKGIEQALRNNSPADSEKRRRRVENDSWESRAQEMLRRIQNNCQ